jgi:hypothetical protein
MKATTAALVLLLAAPAAAEPFGDLILVERLAGTATVQPHVVAVDGGFLVGWNAEGGVTVQAVGVDGRPTGDRQRLDLPYALDLLAAGGGALAISGDHLQHLDAAGPRPPVALESPLPGTHRGHALGGDRLVVATLDRGRDGAILHVQAHDAGGPVVGPPRSWDLGDAFVVALPVAVTGDAALVAWSSGRDVWLGRIEDGEADARLVHQAEPGGALQCCRLTAAPDGRALLAFSDSSRGNFEVVAVPVGADGEPAPAIRLGDHAPEDMLRPQVVWADDRFLIGWVGGVEWGLLQRAGRGVAVVTGAEADAPLRRLEAPGSIERLALAVADGRLALAALVRDAGGLALAVHVAPWP